MGREVNRVDNITYAHVEIIPTAELSRRSCCESIRAMENHSPNSCHMSSEAEQLACEFARRVEHAVEGLQQLLDITSDNDGRIHLSFSFLFLFWSTA